jgi:hypothetical protein
MLAMPSLHKLLVGVGVVSTLCVPEATGSPVEIAIHNQMRPFRLPHKLWPARRRSHAAAPRGPSAKLRAIVLCESGGNPRAIGGGGAFRGAYQFDRGTWTSLGGHGDPAAASMAEQTHRAEMLYARSGSTPWGACGNL